ncbi:MULTISPECIES: twin-arginine translocation signal domain-containing protein [unclassified Streptomyces]
MDSAQGKSRSRRQFLRGAAVSAAVLAAGSQAPNTRQLPHLSPDPPA